MFLFYYYFKFREDEQCTWKMGFSIFKRKKLLLYNKDFSFFLSISSYYDMNNKIIIIILSAIKMYLLRISGYSFKYRYIYFSSSYIPNT